MTEKIVLIGEEAIETKSGENGNVIVGHLPMSEMGSNNTIVNLNNDEINKLLNSGKTISIGTGSQSSLGGIAIGTGAEAHPDQTLKVDINIKGG